MTRKAKSKRQVGFLLSGGSPLSPEQKANLRRELTSGEVRMKKSSKQGR
jgi:hypothetical protein